MNKKIKIKKAIYGKNVFRSMEELHFYKRYKEMKVHKDLVDDIHQAVGRCEGFIHCDSPREELDAWQFLINTGYAWSFHGWFGRRASFLIEEGFCKRKVVH